MFDIDVNCAPFIVRNALLMRLSEILIDIFIETNREQEEAVILVETSNLLKLLSHLN